MIFGEIIVQLREYLLLDLAHHLSQSYNCFFELRQCLSATNFQKIVLSFSALKWLAGNGSFKIQSDKVSRLHDSAIFNRLQPRMTLLESTERLIDLVIGNNQFDLLDLDPQIIFDFDRRLDLENS